MNRTSKKRGKPLDHMVWQGQIEKVLLSAEAFNTKNTIWHGIVVQHLLNVYDELKVQGLLMYMRTLSFNFDGRQKIFRIVIMENTPQYAQKFTSNVIQQICGTDCIIEIDSGDYEPWRPSTS
jgi:hypothetical protein